MDILILARGRSHKPTFSPGGGITGVEITKISAKAKNIAFLKEVALLYQQPNGTWTEKLLAWLTFPGDWPA